MSAGVSGSLGTEVDEDVIVAGAEGRVNGSSWSSPAFSSRPCGGVASSLADGASVGTEGTCGSWGSDGAASSDTSSTEGCRERAASCDADCITACTSGSLSAGLSSSSGSFTAGFVALGSSPALSAFAILSAWYLANLILAATSGSGGFQICRSSRKVAAAWNVSAVCLWLTQSAVVLVDLRGKISGNRPRHFVCPHGCLRTTKDLQSKLLHVGACGHCISHRVIIGVFTLELWTVSVDNFPSATHSIGRTFSNLSTRFVVYSLISSSDVCSPRSIIWFTMKKLPADGGLVSADSGSDQVQHSHQ